jgi:4-diphosphocytidyl-2-C-methyl-D-erythritol kinase
MIKVRSFAKINVGLRIGAARADGFHELRTVYQTIALHDVIGIDVVRGSGVEIRCADSRVPTDRSNTCFAIAERVMSRLGARGRVVIEIEKRLPVQGGLGGASSNAVTVLLALERVLKKSLSGPQRLRIAAEVGSDLPLFLVGGTSLGVGRGEQVYPLPDLPSTACVIVAPEIGVSTPQAFRDWDKSLAELHSAGDGRASFDLAQHGPGSTGCASEPKQSPQSRTHEGDRPYLDTAKLTVPDMSDRMNEFGRTVSSWLSGYSSKRGKPASGVPAGGRGRAENPLLDLVHTGIENDFEKVVFPKYPELCEIKQALLRTGAFYASLSGSGSALYGLFGTRQEAQNCALRLKRQGISATATTTLTRQQYWKKFLVSGF